jgi:hypothetical protein
MVRLLDDYCQPQTAHNNDSNVNQVTISWFSKFSDVIA